MSIPFARRSISMASAIRTATSTGRATNLASNFLLTRHMSTFRQFPPTVEAPILRRNFSSEAVATKEAEPTTEAAAAVPQDLTFSTERVKDLYERMAKLKKEEVSLVGELVLENLDLTVEPDEFYYYGVGKRGGGGKGGGAAAEAVEEVKKDKFDVKLMGFDPKMKIKVIKEVRALTGLGLKDAKDMVESAPKTIQKDLKTENAEELKAKLEALGATIELV